MLILKIIILSFSNNHSQHYAIFNNLLIFSNLFLTFIIVNLINFLDFQYFILNKLFVNLIFCFEQLITYLLLSFMILFFNLLF